MKKLNTYIDYMKLVIVLILIFLASEPTKTGLMILITAFLIACAMEAYLVYRRMQIYQQYMDYFDRLNKAVKDTMQKTKYEDAA